MRVDSLSSVYLKFSSWTWWYSQSFPLKRSLGVVVLSHSWVLYVEVGVTQGSLSACPPGIWIYLGGPTYPHHLFSPLCGIASEESLCPAPLALAFKPGVSGGQRDLSLFIFHFLVIWIMFLQVVCLLFC